MSIIVNSRSIFCLSWKNALRIGNSKQNILFTTKIAVYYRKLTKIYLKRRIERIKPIQLNGTIYELILILLYSPKRKVRFLQNERCNKISKAANSYHESLLLFFNA